MAICGFLSEINRVKGNLALAVATIQQSLGLQEEWLRAFRESLTAVSDNLMHL